MWPPILQWHMLEPLLYAQWLQLACGFTGGHVYITGADVCGYVWETIVSSELCAPPPPTHTHNWGPGQTAPLSPLPPLLEALVSTPALIPSATPVPAGAPAGVAMLSANQTALSAPKSSNRLYSLMVPLTFLNNVPSSSSSTSGTSPSRPSKSQSGKMS